MVGSGVRVGGGMGMLGVGEGGLSVGVYRSELSLDLKQSMQ